MSNAHRIIDMADRITHDAIELGGEVLILRELLIEIRRILGADPPMVALPKIKGILEAMSDTLDR